MPMLPLLLWHILLGIDNIYSTTVKLKLEGFLAGIISLEH